jgi:hypothetical protein
LPRENLVSRLTKNIRLVLISSSLVLPGCGPQSSNGLRYMPRSAGGGRPAIPSACGPVDGQYSGGSVSGGYHGPVERPEGAPAEGAEGCVAASGNYSQGSGGYDPSYRHYGGGYHTPIIIRGPRIVTSGNYSGSRPGGVGFSSGRVGTSGGSSFGHTSTTGSHSSVGSVRGGFGSSAHSVSS